MIIYDKIAAISNKMKALIGGAAIALVVVVIVIVFVMWPKSPEDLAREFISFGNKMIDERGKVQTKDEMLSLYRESIEFMADITPDVILAAREVLSDKTLPPYNFGKDIDSKSNKPFWTALIIRHPDIYKDFLEFKLKSEFNDYSDRIQTDRIQKINKTISDEEWLELLDFFREKATKTINEIADDEDAMVILNLILRQLDYPDGPVTRVDLHLKLHDQIDSYKELLEWRREYKLY